MINAAVGARRAGNYFLDFPTLHRPPRPHLLGIGLSLIDAVALAWRARWGSHGRRVEVGMGRTVELTWGARCGRGGWYLAREM